MDTIADFDPTEWFNSLNLTGQQQPSLGPNNSNDSLDDQLINDLLLNHEELTPTETTSNDDISNALIDSLDNLFESYNQVDNPMSEYTDSYDITAPISLNIEEPRRQSTIEENMESMCLRESRTDRFVSSISVQTGRSPVEPKAIDNSILANHLIREQQRIHKNASKARKTSCYQQSSSTVAPINVISRPTEYQSYTTTQMETSRTYPQQVFQNDTMETEKLEILSHPRMKFRPRTLNESRIASHYIRSDENALFDYPTVRISKNWACRSDENFIEVTLVGIDHQPHAYTIDNKNSKSFYEPDALIFRQNEPHTLYFRVTHDDYANGFKTFNIDFIKSKQDVIITKDFIKERQLEQSKLRFTRIYRTEKDGYQRDEASTEYSCVMTEAYSDVAVEHLGPRYGPMSGDTVYVLLKGRVLKDDLIIEVTDDNTGAHERPTYTKNANLVYFSMPHCSHSQLDRATANITIYYKGEQFYQTNYIYTGSLDQDLAALNLNDASSTNEPSTSNNSDVLNFFSVTNVCPIASSSKRSSAVRRPKRLNAK